MATATIAVTTAAEAKHVVRDNTHVDSMLFMALDETIGGS
jgi:hypothetical protein